MTTDSPRTLPSADSSGALPSADSPRALPSAYSLRALPDLGIDVARLGYVGLALDPLVPQLPDPLQAALAENAYTSTHPKLRSHVTGVQDESHVTLLYGLLHPALTIQPAIDEVLTGWHPGALMVAQFSEFPSPIPGEEYSCLVATLTGTGHPLFASSLHEAHARLSMLPHVNTHLTYTPHVTVAYVHAGAAPTLLTALRDVRSTLTVTSRGLDYGSPR